MVSDPYATAELLDALFQESIDREFDTPDRIWADLGTGTGILAVALALRARRMGSSQRRILGIDSNTPELRIAKILAERLGISQIQYIHGDLENDQFLSSVFSNAKTFPSLIACELVGNRKNYLHEEGDSYTATIIRLHRLLVQHQISASKVRTVPRAVYASLFNSERENHFWVNSPIFRLSLNGPEVIYETTPHPNARKFAEPELQYLLDLYDGKKALKSLKSYKQLGIHSITLDAE
jgi:SAM-dependent methyltransferase